MSTWHPDLRAYARRNLQLVATLRGPDGSTQEVATVDVSAGGAFFRAVALPAIGQHIVVAITPDTHGAAVHVTAEVRWVLQPAPGVLGGFGARWLAAESESAGALLALVRDTLHAPASDPETIGCLHRLLFLAPAVPCRGFEPSPPILPARDLRPSGDATPVLLAASAELPSRLESGTVISIGRRALRMVVQRTPPTIGTRVWVHLLVDDARGLAPLVCAGRVTDSVLDPVAGERWFDLHLQEVYDDAVDGGFEAWVKRLPLAA